MVELCNDWEGSWPWTLMTIPHSRRSSYKEQLIGDFISRFE